MKRTASGLPGHEVRQELQARVRALFRMELDGEDISLRYRPGKGDGVIGRRRHDGRIAGST
jgi:hypothetical protein